MIKKCIIKHLVIFKIDYGYDSDGYSNEDVLICVLMVIVASYKGVPKEIAHYSVIDNITNCNDKIVYL